jgi:hypothetical protein
MPQSVYVILGLLVLLMYYDSKTGAVSSAVSAAGSAVGLMFSKPQRCNNPGALLYSTAEWEGMDPNYPRVTEELVHFVSPEYGMRAQLKLLRNYVLGGCNTISAIVLRWSGLHSPSKKEEYNNYVRHVVDKTGIPANEVLSLSKVVLIAWAMHSFEAGYSWLSKEDYTMVDRKYFK